MKFLILTLSTGEGHNSAARAVAEAAARQGSETEIFDPIDLKSRRQSQMVDKSYNLMITYIPSLFGAIYRAGGAYESTGLPSPLYTYNSTYAEELAGKIEAGGYDAVISTHLYGMEALSAIRRKGLLSIPSFGVETDYTCTPFLKENVLDGLFIPHEDLIPKIMGGSMTREKLIVTGIPVSRVFSETISQQEARNRLDLPQKPKIILIMTGGVGVGQTDDLCSNVVSTLTPHFSDDEWMVIVLTGHNEKTKVRIERRFSGVNNVRTVAFTRRVSDYMKASDVCITKPGGLTSTEAAVSGIALIHLLSVPGVENANVDFFSSHGMSVYAFDMQEAADQALSFLAYPDRCIRMKQAQERNVYPDAADQIVKKVISWVSQVDSV